MNNIASDTPKHLDDAHYVMRARNNEVSAYQVLYDRYKHRIFQYIRLRVDNKEDARDLTARTFHKAFAKITKIKEPKCFRQWLFTIARREIADYHRTKARKIPTTSVEDMPEQELTDESANNPISDSVRWTLNQLSPIEQDILNYRLIQKKELDEIVQLTGKNIDAVKYLLKKARKNFTTIYLSKFKLGTEKKVGDKNETV